MMAYAKPKRDYSPNEIDRFENEKKRIMFQSIFSSLCNLCRGSSMTIEEIENFAYTMVRKLVKTFPTTDEEMTKMRHKMWKEETKTPDSSPLGV
jgi:hypothetical protein